MQKRTLDKTGKVWYTVGHEKETAMGLKNFIYKIALEAVREAINSGLRQEMNAGFADVDKRFVSFREEMTAEFAKVRQEMNAGFAKVDAEFVKVREEMRAGFASIRAEMDSRFEAVNERFDAVNIRLDSLDQRMTAVEKRLDKMEDRFLKVDDRFEIVSQRFAHLEERISGTFEMLNSIKGNLEGEARAYHSVTLMLEAKNAQAHA
jgi:chromosome segregation ATPase